MESVLKKELKDGSMLEVFRMCFPEDCGKAELPEWSLAFFQRGLPECWRLYTADVFAGRAEGVQNSFYAGVVNGVPCSRMWFGYSLRTGSGNFGNVETYPEYRRRGIMHEILKICVADFFRSGALFCSCDASGMAAQGYSDAGFRRIFPENLPPMAITKNGMFSSILEKAYGNTEGATVRAGRLNDRFDCDKLLMYAPEVYDKMPPDLEVPMYLSLWQEYVCRGKTEIRVLETQSGFCAGYAARPEGKLRCILHPAFERYRNELSGEGAQ